MDYRIAISKPWRYRHPKRGAQILAPGEYRVPEDISDTLARRAVAEGMAERIVERMVMSAPVAAKAAAKPRRKPRVSPQNRSLGAAPENKSPVH